MKLGCVKWFSLRKGYGFIVPEDSSEDVFIHISELHNELSPKNWTSKKVPGES